MKRWVLHLSVLILVLIFIGTLTGPVPVKGESDNLATAKVDAKVLTTSIASEELILRLEIEDIEDFEPGPTSQVVELVRGEKISVYIDGGSNPHGLDSASIEKDDRITCIIRAESTTDGFRWVANDGDVEVKDTQDNIPSWVVPVSVVGLIAIFIVLILLSYYRYRVIEVPKQKGDPNYRCGWCDKPVRLSGNSWYCDYCQDYPSEVLPPKH